LQLSACCAGGGRPDQGRGQLGRVLHPALLGPFCRRYPQIEVALQVCNRAQLGARLHANLDDLYFFGCPPDEDGVETVAVGPNHLIVAETFREYVLSQGHDMLREALAFCRPGS
jgi:DNA-binding transcriptional LysR family regulator